MDYATRCKNCRFCEEAKAKNKAPLSNTRYTIYIGGDDDTTTLSHMHEKVPYDVEKCYLHTHNDLPHGKDLHGEQLKKVLTELFNEYCTDAVISKSQRSESLNSVIGTKNPKTRYYGGSKSSYFRVACGIAQVNVGYGYISNSLERLNIEPGELCTTYVTNMDKKTATAKLRKGQKKSKYRRNQLRCQKNSKLAKGEKKEGKTYESNIGLNLQLPNSDNTSVDPLHLTESVTEEQHQRNEKLVPEFCQKPPSKAIAYDPQKCYKLMFDTETTTTGLQAETCQLSATDDDGQNEFSCHIMPEGDVSKYAPEVNKLEISSINEQRELCHKREPVRCTTKNQALN
ncbi:Hypothetical predicted protein [Paramuricea clavata]|uniref:Uncharacterized protein n=1 Tax=Paramuricea clavata TaxID=317549 RepID=A0A7D9DUU2_PARCT|nr:Hypothetical predicted protein [Paramuricea clavata]